MVQGGPVAAARSTIRRAPPSLRSIFLFSSEICSAVGEKNQSSSIQLSNILILNSNYKIGLPVKSKNRLKTPLYILNLLSRSKNKLGERNPWKDRSIVGYRSQILLYRIIFAARFLLPFSFFYMASKISSQLSNTQREI